MMGEGTMYEQMGRSMSGNLFDPAPDTPEELSPENIPVEEGEIHQSAPSEAPISEEAKAEIPEPASDTDLRAASEALGAASILGSKKIVQVMVIYADDTFRAFTPAH